MEELVFKYVPVELKLEGAFGRLVTEQDTVTVLLRDKFGRWVLGRKRHYPEGVARLIGGGIEDGESPLVAARREIREELRLEVDEEKLTPLVHGEIIGQLPDGGQAKRSVFVFYGQAVGSMVADDDLDDLVYLNDHELILLAERCLHLAPDPLPADKGGGSWADWGKIWGTLNQASLERVKELGL